MRIYLYKYLLQNSYRIAASDLSHVTKFFFLIVIFILFYFSIYFLYECIFIKRGK